MTSTDEPSSSPAELRREVAAAFVVLFAIVAAHALAETARDTLFLRGLPPERLPWAYLTIAGIVLVTSPQVEKLARHRRAVALRCLLVAGAVGHVAFAVLAAKGDPRVLFALYVWCGLLTTELVIQFWLLIGARVDVQRAKRAFARIAAGGVGGAVAGAGLASLLTLALPVGALLGAAAAVLLAALAASFALVARRAPASPERATAALIPLLGDVYAIRVVSVIALLAAITTAIDYVFKATVAAELPSDRLDDFFARYHTVVNAGALAFQLAATPWLLQRLGVTRALLVLPSLVALGSVAVAWIGGLVPALALRAIDGVLRPSLHGAASEILFLPLPEPQRGLLRSIAASVGQRGGQAAASVALLLAIGAGAQLPAVVAGAAVASVGLCAAAASLRARYVERFRSGLRELGDDAPLEVPSLDLDALESLFAALASPDPDEVTVALDLLAAYGKEHLIPPLILYHPSPRVVTRALGHFTSGAPTGLAPLLPWLLGHADPEVRAAALATLARRGELRPEQERPVLDALVAGGPSARPALARAVAALPPERALSWIEVLAKTGDSGVEAALAEELARAPLPAHIPLLIPLLDSPRAREPARRALCALGAPALAALAAALAGEATPQRVRRHLPRSISRFECEAAAPLLTAALAGERDPRVRFKILRGLGRLRAGCPELAIDESPVREHAVRSLERVITMLGFQLAVRVASADGDASGRLLARLLIEKEQRALERVFRALHILHPDVEYRALFEAIRGGDSNARAAAEEVLEHVAPEPLRTGLLAVVGPAPVEERLAAALAFHAPFGAEALVPLAKGEPPDDLDAVRPLLAALWKEMAHDADPVLAAVAARAQPASLEVPDGRG